MVCSGLCAPVGVGVRIRLRDLGYRIGAGPWVVGDLRGSTRAMEAGGTWRAGGAEARQLVVARSVAQATHGGFRFASACPQTGNKSRDLDSSLSPWSIPTRVIDRVSITRSAPLPLPGFQCSIQPYSFVVREIQVDV